MVSWAGSPDRADRHPSGWGSSSHSLRDQSALTVHPGGYRYTQFCEIYRERAWRLRPSMHQVHRAGEKTFIDFSGKRPTLVDRHTGGLWPVELSPPSPRPPSASSSRSAADKDTGGRPPPCRALRGTGTPASGRVGAGYSGIDGGSDWDGFRLISSFNSWLGLK